MWTLLPYFLLSFAASPDSGSPVHENAEHVIKVVRAKPWLVHVIVLDRTPIPEWLFIILFKSSINTLKYVRFRGDLISQKKLTSQGRFTRQQINWRNLMPCWKKCLVKKSKLKKELTPVLLLDMSEMANVKKLLTR